MTNAMTSSAAERNINASRNHLRIRSPSDSIPKHMRQQQALSSRPSPAIASRALIAPAAAYEMASLMTASPRVHPVTSSAGRPL
jgi:hypothetical protein